MVTLNSSPGDPDLYAGMSVQAKLSLLLTTLTREQGAAVTSAAGIGAGEMDSDQKAAFVSILQSLQVQNPENVLRSLTENEVQQSRLRLNRFTRVVLKHQDGRSSDIDKGIGSKSGSDGKTLLAFQQIPAIRKS
jgi:hypothetical protein